jgi:hypothetical protein
VRAIEFGVAGSRKVEEIGIGSRKKVSTATLCVRVWSGCCYLHLSRDRPHPRFIPEGVALVLDYF